MKRLIYFILIIVSTKISIAQSDSIVSNIKYTEFHYSNGKISSEGYLKDNKPIGFWKSYYVTGVKKSEGKWQNNKLDSIWIFYNQLGDTTEKINYYLGKKNGYYYKYFTGFEDQNRVKSKDLYINGSRNGKSILYYKNGIIGKEIPYVNDKKHGVGFEYDQEGNIITITRFRNNEIIVQEEINRYDEEDRKVGTWKKFYDNGNLKEEKSYSQGKLDGYLKRYNEDGKLVTAVKYNNGEVDLTAKDFDTGIEIKEDYDKQGNLIFQGSFKKEIPIGIHRYFNNNGEVVKSETYDIEGNLIAKGVVLQNGLEDGSWVYYYSNGKKRAEGVFRYGIKTGNWTYYYPNGKIQQKGSYTSGKLTGSWEWYYETGELLREEYYIYGSLDGESVEYSVLGEIISKGNYIEGYKEGDWIFVVGDQKNLGKYVMGEKNGTWKSFYIEENSKSFVGDYLQGNPEGKHIYYYPNGKIKEERYYSEGQKVKAWSKYDNDGELILVVQYRDGIPYKINGERIQFDNMQN